ncbi:hypothetical protein, partial [Algoriphagus sp.]
MNENNLSIPEPIEAESAVLDSYLSEFKRFNKDVSEQNSAETLYSYLFTQGKSLLKSFIKAGESFLETSDKPLDITGADHYLVHFSYPDRFKSIALLLRDVLLQLSIAKLRAAEELVTESLLEEHFQKSQNLLTTELETALNYFVQERKALQEKPGILKRRLESVKHFANPWNTYKIQFDTLCSQFDEIDQSDERLNETIAEYGLIRNMILQLRIDIQNTNSLFATKGEECLKELKKTTDLDQVSVSIKAFEELTSLGVGLEVRSENTLRHLEDSVDKLPTLSVPISTVGGNMVVRKIDFRKSSEKWLDYEILPYLTDLWDLQEATYSQLLNVAAQIKSSLQVAKKTQQLVSCDAEIAALSAITAQQTNAIRQSTALIAYIEVELAKNFKVTEIYQQEEYLKVPFQTNFTRLASTKQGSLNSFWYKITHLFTNLGKQVKEVKEKTPHQKLEIALEILETRNEKEAPDHYHSLFLNKNFIGDLFLVKRKAHEDEVLKTVNNWKKGQSRSLAILGDPLSGKSTLLEYVSHQFKSNEVHHLSPGAEISIEGRKLKMNRNLGEVLAFVKRSVRNSKPILVLDDLHLWRSDEHSLLTNAATLVDFISSSSTQVFVVIGMTHALRVHLDSRMSFSQGISNLLDTNFASSDAIFRAVMLRHGASHRTIYEKDGVIMNEAQLQKKITWLAKKFNFNIGAVLQAWIFCTDVQEDGSIRFTEKETHLNDFLSISELLILKNCLLFGYSSDLELKNLFSESYETEFKPAVRKLLNIGVLDRDTNGY